MANIINRIRFQLIRMHSLKKLRRMSVFDREAIYITFDDGPEPDITEFVLDELKKYNAKATFFCCGENCAKHTHLLNRIKEEGHTIANHTHSHINGYYTSANDYIKNVDECEEFLNTKTFRPPWGALTFRLYNRLRKKYRIVFWDVVSYDTELDRFNLNVAYDNLVNKIKPGCIVLFHFCKKHENETKQILPAFLQYIKNNNIKTKTI